MKTSTRIYIVAAPDGSVRLIESYSAAEALRQAVGDKYSVRPVKTSEVVKYVHEGKKIEPFISRREEE